MPFLLLGLAACWDEAHVVTKRIVPGALALPGVNHLILHDFSGPGGAEVAHAVSHKLLRRRSFAVTDLTSQRAFAGYGSGDGGELARAASTGLSTDAGIFATVVQHEIEDDLTYEEKGLGEGRAVTTYVRSGTLHLQVLFRAVDAASGALWDARSVSLHVPLGQEQVVVQGHAVADADYIQSWFAARNHAELFLRAYDQVAEAFCDLVQMQQEASEVSVYHNSHDAGSVRALEGIQRGEWGQPLSIYRAYLARVEINDGVRDADRAMAHYNVGVAYAYSGDLTKGLYELEWSQALHDTEMVRGALAKVQAWLWETQGPQF